MAHPTDAMHEFRRQAEFLEKDAYLSERGQFTAAAAWGWIHLGLGLPATVAAGLAAVPHIAGAVAPALAVVAAVLVALMTFVNPAKRQETHHAAGVDFNALRGRVRNFVGLQAPQLTDAQRYEKLDALGERKTELNRGSPQIPRWAYLAVRRKLGPMDGDYAFDLPTKES